MLLQGGFQRRGHRIEFFAGDLAGDTCTHNPVVIKRNQRQQAQLETRYQALQNASEDNWDAAKVKFQQSWEAAKQGWQSLTAPAPEQE